MSNAIVTRVLSADDLPLMRRTLDLFGQAFDEPSTYSAQQPEDGYLRELLGSSSFVTIAALAGDEIVGGLAGYVLPKFEQRRSEFYIYDLAVSAQHRRMGIATALIGELQKLAAARGIYAIFVQADHGDDAAIALYTQLGLREDVLHFDIEPAKGGA
jgi:aminoglycoside 3-N-acetyltransferase I